MSFHSTLAFRKGVATDLGVGIQRTDSIARKFTIAARFE